MLLKELHDHPRHVTASTLRTLYQSVELLAVLFERASFGPLKPSTPSRVLVVDDDPVSGKLVSFALGMAQLEAVNLEDSRAAYEKLQTGPFALVVTDVKMPGMSGFELCEKLRALPGHAKTPVIFVTVANDFATRVHSARSGVDDFIAKPFLAIELAVKALSQLLQIGLQNVLPGFRPFHPES